MTEATQLFREIANGSLPGVQQALAFRPTLLAATDTQVKPAALLSHCLGVDLSAASVQRLPNRRRVSELAQASPSTLALQLKM